MQSSLGPLPGPGVGSGVNVGCCMRKAGLGGVQQTANRKGQGGHPVEPRPQKRLLPDLAREDHGSMLTAVLPGLHLLKPSSQVFLRSSDRTTRIVTGGLYDYRLKQLGL